MINPGNHNCATVTEEPSGLYTVREYGWTKDSPYGHPGSKPLVRTRGSYVTHSRACDEADWVNYPELRREKT